MKISVIGAGAMGGSMVEGFIKAEALKTADITISDPSAKAIERFDAMGVSVTSDNKAAVIGADIIAVVVKPWLVERVIKEIKDELDYSRQLLVVIAAGVSSQSILQWLEKGNEPLPSLFLVIPNTAIAVMSSMTFIVPIGATAEQTRIVSDLYDKTGQTLIVEEHLLPAATTLASCGIAYAMRYIRASTEGGVEIGFKAKDAQDIVMQTVKGAVCLLQATGNHPEVEIDKVTTPGGVTIKGLNEMEHAGFTAAVIRGLKAGLNK